MGFGIGGQVTWAAAIQASASLIGFIVIGYQVIQLRKNILGATQDRLYAHYMEILKLFMENLIFIHISTMLRHILNWTIIGRTYERK